MREILLVILIVCGVIGLGSYNANEVGEDQWKDIFVANAGLRGGTANPDVRAFGPSGLIYQLAFIGTTSRVEEIFGTFEMQHDYAEGTDFSIHIHWAPETNAVGNVKWFLAYDIMAPGVAAGAPEIVSVVAAAGGVAWTHHVSVISAISGTGQVMGSAVAFRLYRNPADADDTYAAYAHFLQLGIHYRVNTHGSRTVGNK